MFYISYLLPSINDLPSITCNGIVNDKYTTFKLHKEDNWVHSKIYGQSSRCVLFCCAYTTVAYTNAIKGHLAYDSTMPVERPICPLND